MPLLLVGGLFYWTIALGLGGLSLMAVSALSAGGRQALDLGGSASDDGAALLVPGGQAEQEPEQELEEDGQQQGGPRAAGDPIQVHLQESVDPEDVNDNAGAGSSTSLEPTAVEPVPGI
jgi:hypothetical protein